MAPSIDAIEFAVASLKEIGGEIPSGAMVEHRQLRGGLESSVSEVTLRFRDAKGRPRLLRTIVKDLEGRMVREASVYEDMVTRCDPGVAPQLIGVGRPDPKRAFLCIEPIRRASAWPWQDIRLAGDLLRRLARFHMRARQARSAIPHWNFEEHLEEMSHLTVAAVDRCRRHPELGPLARSLPAVRRLTLQQTRLREQLNAEAPFGNGPIHGDVHSGNVLARRRDAGLRPVLLDWGRARAGSPLEDISSWLQSLGFYEVEARRYHDKLFCDYLSELGRERTLTQNLRAAYWIAGARNALAGALLHFICVAENESNRKRDRANAFHAAWNWARVIRRADACSRA